MPRKSYCDDHQRSRERERHRQTDRKRLSSRQRGYTRDWEKARVAWLIEYPWCEDCRKESGRLVAGDVVDHKVPHRGDMTLFWDRRNWQTLCTTHHSRKTAREDGGFGNTPADAV